MCIATAALVAGVVGTAVSAAGAISQGQAASAAAHYQAQVANNNAVTANQNAQYAIQAGTSAATTKSLQSRAALGAVVAGEAANNVDVNSGSAKDVQVSQREAGELDTVNTMNNALLNAYGYNTQATSFKAEAGLKSAEASSDITGSEIGAAGTLLQGAGSIGFKWGSLSQGNPTSAGNTNENIG